MALKQRRAGGDEKPPRRGKSAEQVAVVPDSDHVVGGLDAKNSTAQKTKSSTADDTMNVSFIARQPLWVLLAIASGACAAINGVFAKLTTTSLTSTLASHVSSLLGLSPTNTIVNVVLRGSFFGLNLLFNAVMWGLFTAALTRGNSTTRVSIVNVSTNFFVTAMFGWAIFGEKLPLQWWVGAGLLAVGNVVIGSSREDGEGDGARSVAADARDEQEGLLERTSEEGASRIEMETQPHDEDKARADVAAEERRLQRGEDIDDPV